MATRSQAKHVQPLLDLQRPRSGVPEKRTPPIQAKVVPFDIENCHLAFAQGQAGGDATLPAGFQWNMVCPITVDQLQPTDHQGVDYCAVCKEHVYTVGNRKELAEHVSQQHCVSFDTKAFDISYTGMQEVRRLASSMENAGKVKRQTPKVAGMIGAKKESEPRGRARMRQRAGHRAWEAVNSQAAARGHSDPSSLASLGSKPISCDAS